MAQIPARPSIRVTALGLLRRDDGKILVEYASDRSTGQHFYRALGGGVEFGESAPAALAREFAEELGIAITVGARRAVFENIFTYEGKPGHEIVFVHDVAVNASAFYAQETPQRIDGSASLLCWRTIDDIEKEKVPLYPAGFAALVSRSSQPA